MGRCAAPEVAAAHRMHMVICTKHTIHQDPARQTPTGRRSLTWTGLCGLFMLAILFTCLAVTNQPEVK
ncbi:hypothetical protein BH23GEM8_BH23GEM8_08920 [soil metagenome]